MSPIEFAALLEPLGAGERLVAARIFRTLVKRLAMGQRQYGLLDPVNDRRDWVKEAHEELVDGMVYSECELIRNEAFTGAAPFPLVTRVANDTQLDVDRFVTDDDVDQAADTLERMPVAARCG